MSAAQRLFFALWPDAEARRALEDATGKVVRHSGGRPVPAENTHLTLAFLGSVPAERIPELKRLARRQAVALAQERPLSVTFERLTHWREPQILCALATSSSPAIEALASALKDATAAAGFTPDLKPFRAHVTVARKVAHAAQLPALRPVEWRFEAFALVDSRTDSRGAVYSVVESYPLVKLHKVDG